MLFRPAGRFYWLVWFPIDESVLLGMITALKHHKKYYCGRKIPDQFEIIADNFDVGEAVTGFIFEFM